MSFLKSVTQRECTKVSLVTAESCIIPNSKKETTDLELFGNLILSKLIISVVGAY